MALIGAGSVPTLVAFAQMVEDEQMVITDAGLGLSTIDSHPNPDKMRTPSGLGTLEEQATGTRTATVVPKPAAARRPAARPAAPAPQAATAAAPGGAAWKTARVSWYGPGFYGNTMAGGGVLQPGSMVVAHRSLAFGTKIEFSYKGRTCVATVQDRGPFTAGRVFDLGPGTAKALGFSGVGT
ncbi:MAG: septal ring lytic transglycosylase RlpA family protein, partial [Coriobacteriia bacterium]